jgi:hypothetical protein
MDEMNDEFQRNVSKERVDETKQKKKKPSFEKKVGSLDIYPISKGRRVLLFLGDYFLYFIITIFVFTIAVFPLSRIIVNSNALEDQTNANTKAETSLLVSNNLLYAESEELDVFNNDISYTQKLFTKGTLQDSLSYNPFYNFYVDILGNDLASLKASYDTFNTKKFFSSEVGQNGLYKFNETYASEFAPLLDEKNEMTSQAKSDYSSFSSSFFLPFYNQIISEIKDQSKLPSSSSLREYLTYDKDNTNIKNHLDLALTLSCYISYVIVGLVLFLLVPLLNKKGKTLTMMAMGLVRIGNNNLCLISKGERALDSIYYFVLFLSFIPFLPLAYISNITNLFDLPALDMVALVSFGFVIISLIVLLFNQFNMDLLDFSSRSIVIDEESYSEIEKERNNGRF